MTFAQPISISVKDELCRQIVQSPPNFSVLQTIIEQGADLHCECEVLRKTDFLTGQQAIVRFFAPSVSVQLLQENSNGNAAIERVNASPLQIALERNDYALIRFLIGQGVDLNAVMANGLRPLELSLHERNEPLAAFLLRMGANPRLMQIGCPFSIDLTRFFIAKGADPTTITIDCALLNEPLAEALIDLNPNFKGSNLSQYSFNELVEKPQLLSFLFAKGFSPNGVNNSIEKRTLLSLAAEMGKMDAVTSLLKYDADVNTKDAMGYTPLCYAILEGHRAVSEELIRNGAKVNVRIGANDQKTPFSLAFQQKDGKMMQLLMEHGADLFATQEDFLAQAVAANDQEMIRQLVTFGAKPHRLLSLYGSNYLLANPKTFEFIVEQGALSQGDQLNFTLQAIKQGKEGIANILIAHQTGLNNTDDDGKSPLHYAFEQQNYALAYRLIDYGANVNQEVQGFEPFLHRAVRSGNLVMVHKLIQNGAEVNAQNEAEETVLYLAVATKNYEIAKVLLKNEAAIGCKDLFKAIKNEHFSMVKQLVENGADLTCRKGGRSVVQYAKKHNLSYHIEQYLKGKM